MTMSSAPGAGSPGSTLIRLGGRDALDLLHRVTTQSLRDLAPGQCRMTLACDFRGRLLHRVAVACTADGAVWLARDDAPAASLMAFLDRQIFREDITLVDTGDRFAVTLAPGPAPAAAALRERDGVPLELRPDARFALHVIPRATAPTAADEPARIRVGLPRHDHEIHEDFNPFEVGLAAEVHLDKGCYTGQEALLRMMTYGGVRRRLVLLQGTGTPPAPRSALDIAGGDPGVVTSACADGASWIGLGVARRDGIGADAEGMAVTAAGPAHWRTLAEGRPPGLPEPRPSN